MRLIDADALFEVLGLDQYNNAEGMTSDEEWIADAIMSVPTIEAEPVRRGRWLLEDNPDTGWYRIACSKCGEDVTSNAPFGGVVTWDYCPYCGAKMEGQE